MVDLVDIDHRLDEMNYSLMDLTNKLQERDKILREITTIKKSYKTTSKFKKSSYNLTKKQKTHIRKVLYPTCHPDRKYCALDMCKPCYEKNLKNKALPSKCHPSKPSFRGDRCRPCYERWRESLKPKQEQIKNPIAVIGESFWKNNFIKLINIVMKESPFYKLLIKYKLYESGEIIKIRRYNDTSGIY